MYLNLVDMNVTVQEGRLEILNFIKIYTRYSAIRTSLAYLVHITKKNFANLSQTISNAHWCVLENFIKLLRGIFMQSCKKIPLAKILLAGTVLANSKDPNY